MYGKTAPQSAIRTDICKAHEDLYINGVYKPTARGEAPLLYCHPKTLKAFQVLMKDSALLGTAFWNPYLLRYEHFPNLENELNERDMQILTRGCESSNTSGVIKIKKYQGLATARHLVKDVLTLGETEVTHQGGFHLPRSLLDLPQKRMMVSQSGHQAQDPMNIVASWFYLDSQEDMLKLAEYLHLVYPNAFGSQAGPMTEDGLLDIGKAWIHWQHEAYKARHGKSRPERNAIKNGLEVTWKPKRQLDIAFKGIIDLDEYRKSFVQEIKDPLFFINAMMLLRKDGKKAAVCIPMAGMGAFSGGLVTSGALLKVQWTRLEGFNDFLRDCIRNKIKLEGIASLGMFFSKLEDRRGARLLAEIEKNLGLLGIRWLGCGETDFINNPENEIVVEFNAADPHALDGNEGTENNSAEAFEAFVHAFQSLDPKQYFNAHMEHFNIFFNPEIKIVHKLTPEGIQAAKSCTIRGSNDWAYQYQCAMNYPDIHASALFYRGDMARELLVAEELKTYIACCLYQLSKELQESAAQDATQSVGKTALLGILYQYDKIMKNTDDIELLVNLIKKMFFLSVIANQYELTADMHRCVYADFHNALKHQIQKHLAFINGKCEEAEIHELGQAILAEAFNINRHFLIQKLNARNTPDAVIAVIQNLEALEQNRGLLVTMESVFKELADFTQSCKVLETQLELDDSTSVIQTIKNLEAALTVFSAAAKKALNKSGFLQSPINSILCNSLQSINPIYKTQPLYFAAVYGAELYQALSEKIQDKILGDFNRQGLQERAGKLLASPDSLRELTRHPLALHIIAYMLKAFDLIEKKADYTEIYKALDIVLLTSYNDTTTGQEAVNGIADRLIADKLCRILDEHAQSVTSISARQIIALLKNHFQAKADAFGLMGKDQATFCILAIRELMQANAFPGTNFASDFTNNLSGEVAFFCRSAETAKIMKAMKQIAKNDPVAKEARQVEFETRFTVLTNDWNKQCKNGNERILAARSLLDVNREILQTCAKILPEGFYCQEYADLDKACTNAEAAMQRVDKLVSALADLFRAAGSDSFWKDMKAIHQALYQANASLQECESLLLNLSRTMANHPDKARLEQDINHIEGLTSQLQATRDLLAQKTAEHREAHEAIAKIRATLPDLKIYDPESDIKYIQSEITGFEDYLKLNGKNADNDKVKLTYATTRTEKVYEGTLATLRMTISDKKRKLDKLKADQVKLYAAQEILKQKELETQIHEKKNAMEEALNATGKIGAELLSVREKAKKGFITAPEVIKKNRKHLENASDINRETPMKALQKNSIFKEAFPLGIRFTPVTRNTWPESRDWGLLSCLGATISFCLLPGGDQYFIRHRMDTPLLELDNLGLHIFFRCDQTDSANYLFKGLQNLNRLPCSFNKVNKSTQHGDYSSCVSIPQKHIPAFMHGICEYPMAEVEELLYGKLCGDIKNMIQAQSHDIAVSPLNFTAAKLDIAGDGSSARYPETVVTLWKTLTAPAQAKYKIAKMKAALEPEKEGSVFNSENVQKLYNALYQLILLAEQDMQPEPANTQPQISG